MGEQRAPILLEDRVHVGLLLRAELQALANPLSSHHRPGGPTCRPGRGSGPWPLCPATESFLPPDLDRPAPRTSRTAIGKLRAADSTAAWAPIPRPDHPQEADRHRRVPAQTPCTPQHQAGRSHKCSCECPSVSHSLTSSRALLRAPCVAASAYTLAGVDASARSSPSMPRAAHCPLQRRRRHHRSRPTWATCWCTISYGPGV